MKGLTQLIRVMPLAIILALPSNAAAALITFGDPGSAEANGFPFGGWYQSSFNADRYQQVYDGALFGGTSAIQSVSFYAFAGAGTNADGAYTLALSSTSRAVNALSTSMADNVGGDSVTFFSGTLPAFPAGGGLLTFTLPAPFVFEPAGGNLLLDIQMSGVTDPGQAFYIAHNGSFGTTSSRMVNGDATSTASWGLVTTFDADPVETAAVATLNRIQVPEPAALVLLALGLASAAGALRSRWR